jgi:hypothetical protein
MCWWGGGIGGIGPLVFRKRHTIPPYSWLLPGIEPDADTGQKPVSHSKVQRPRHSVQEPGDRCPPPSDIDLTPAFFCGIQDLICGFLRGSYPEPSRQLIQKERESPTCSGSQSFVRERAVTSRKEPSESRRNSANPHGCS